MWVIIMWVSKYDDPIPTYGNDGKEFMLSLTYQNYYGHNHLLKTEVVNAIWNSVNESFYETETHKDIDDRDIKSWWKEN